MKYLALTILCFYASTCGAAVMTSGNYQIERDSVNFGGGNSSSGSYSLETTEGETGTGKSQSATLVQNAGYQQNNPEAIVTPTPTPTLQSTGGSSGSRSRTDMPVNVINFKAEPFSNKSINLSWDYPKDSAIARVMIVRSEIFFPTDPTDGLVIFDGDTLRVIDTNVMPGVQYYYTLFAVDHNGNISSGVVAQSIIYANDSPVLTSNPFESIVDALQVDPRFNSLVLSDFNFIQDGRIIVNEKGMIVVDGEKNTTVRLLYDKVPEVLKTIAMSLTDPEDPSKIFTFLLRINKEKTAYEATIGPLGKSGEYALRTVVIDYENKALKRIEGKVKVLAFGEAGVTASFPNKLILPTILLSLAILLLGIFFKRKIVAAAILALILVGAFYIQTTHAAINKQVNYQGKLTDSTGDLVTDGTYAMEFNLYTASSGGTAIWTETLTGVNEVTVSDGLFSVMLGSVSSLNSVDFNQTLYLGVNVESDGEMSPRKVIGAVPAAFVADTLDGIDSTQFLRSDTGSVTSGYFLSTSTTASTFPYASTTVLSASTLCITTDCRTSWPTGSAFPFDSTTFGSTNANATGTLLGFTSGLYSLASSTIGNGNQNGGLTISGGATTTGNAYFAGNVGVGTASPTTPLYISKTVAGPTTIATFINSETNGLPTTALSFSTGGNIGAITHNRVSAASGGRFDFSAGSFSFSSNGGTGNGNLGIGTTSPYAKLSVTNTGTDPSFLVEDSTSPDSTPFIIDAAGNVGIGNVTPLAMLDVKGTGQGRVMLGQYVSDNGYGVISLNGQTPSATNYNFRSASGPTDLFINTISGSNIYFQSGASTKITMNSDGNFGIGTTSPYAKLSVVGPVVAEYFHATSTTATSTFAGGLVAGNGSLNVLQNGNVGIGTITPNTKLHVSDGIASFEMNQTSGEVAKFISTNNWATGRGVNIGFYVPYSTGQNQLGGSIGATIDASGLSNRSLVFNTGNSGTLAEAMRINGSGNVGIGTTSPYAKLSVAGSSHLGGDLVATGTVALSGLALSTTGNYLCIDTTTNQITSGTSCTLSSNRFKHNVNDLDLGLDTVLALRPVSFEFNNGYGDNGQTSQLGFVAEEADAIDSRLVPHDKDGLSSGFNYQNYTAVLTKAIQEQQKEIILLKNASTTIAHASTTIEMITHSIKTIGMEIIDGILYVKEIISDKLTTKELCLEEVCITKDELKMLLDNSRTQANLGGNKDTNSNDEPGEPDESNKLDESDNEQEEPTVISTATTTESVASTTEPISGTAESVSSTTEPVVIDEPQEPVADVVEGENIVPSTSEVDVNTDEENQVIVEVEVPETEPVESTPTIPLEESI